MRAKDRPLENDFMSDADFAAKLKAWFSNLSRVLIPGGAFYIWGGYANISNYPVALEYARLFFAQTIIWVKEHPVLTRKDFMGNHEWCFYGWKDGVPHRYCEWCFYGWRKGAGHRFYGPPNVTDVWEVKKVNPQSMVHLTQKPVELAIRAMEYSSRAGENVLDLFGGSGQTLMAAEHVRRRSFSMEIDRPYCDVILTRWQNATGRQATLDGVPFSEVAARRASLHEPAGEAHHTEDTQPERRTDAPARTP